MALLILNLLIAQGISLTNVFNHQEKNLLSNKQIDVYNTYTKQKEVLEPRIVELKSEEFLLNNIVSSTSNAIGVDLNITNDISIRALGYKVEYQNERHWTWHGNLQGNVQNVGYTFITVNRGNLSGVIQTKENRFILAPLGDYKGILHEVDFSIIDYENYCSVTNSGSSLYDIQNSNFSSTRYLDKLISTVTYHALVCYTPAARAALGSTANMETFIDDRMTETNLIYSNSYCSPRIEVVCTYEVSGNATGNSLTNVQRLRNPSDGHWDNIHSIRTNYGADVVMLITQNGNDCGRVETIPAYSSTAFATMLVNTGCKYSFAHEIGHLFGARHDRESDNTSTPYVYGHGYYKKNSGVEWQTVMSIFLLDNNKRIKYLSSPDILYGGDPIGTAQYEDVARVHDVRAGTVAGFKPFNFQVTIDGPFSLGYKDYGTFVAYPNGGSSYLWYKKVGGGSYSYVGSGQYHSEMMLSSDFTVKCDVTKNGVTKSGTRTVEYDPNAKIAEIPGDGIEISVNYPNPFNPSTNIAYSIDEPSDVTVTVYDIMGNEVINWDYQNVSPGNNQVQWTGIDFNGNKVSAGTYLYTVSITSKTTGKTSINTKKMLLLK